MQLERRGRGVGKGLRGKRRASDGEAVGRGTEEMAEEMRLRGGAWSRNKGSWECRGLVQ